MTQNVPEGRPSGNGPSFGQAVLAVLCAAAVVAVCAASVLFAMGQTVEYVPGAGLRLAAAAPSPAGAPTSAPAALSTPAAAQASLASRAAQATLPVRPGSAPPAPLPVVARPSPARPGGQAAARRSQDGHFYFDVEVNGTPMHMVFDTGASLVVLRAEDAAKIGLNVGAMAFSVESLTANGRVSYAPVVIASVTIGGITQLNVPAWSPRRASWASPCSARAFMARLAGYRFDGDQLILQGQ